MIQEEQMNCSSSLRLVYAMLKTWWRAFRLGRNNVANYPHRMYNIDVNMAKLQNFSTLNFGPGRTCNESKFKRILGPHLIGRKVANIHVLSTI